jgi:diamine N-acetyltransferase
MTLRALEPEDLDFLFALENDPDLWAVSDVLPVPISRHALREYLRHSAASLAEAGQMRLIITGESEQAVGTLDLYDYSALHQRAGVGIAVLKSERRHGYAQAALAQLLPYARQSLRLHQLYCTIAETNEPSIRLFEKAGFQLVGLRQQWLRNNTHTGWVNAAEMQILLRK